MKDIVFSRPQRVFKVDKMAFSKLPLWKQTKQKKEVGLF